MQNLFSRSFWRGTAAERTVFTPVLTGARFYTTDTAELYIWTGAAWTLIGPSSGTGVPSGTVVTEQTYGQASTAGVLATYSRGDHTHGTSPHDDHALLTNVLPTQHHTNANDPSAGEKAALPGTSGTPGAGNKYVTDLDARNTNDRIPTAHGSSKHTGTIGTWAQIDKATSNISDITTKSHTTLSDIGTNAHSAIDTHLGAAAPHSGHEQTANKGAISGYAPLDAAQKVPTVNLGGAGAGGSNFLRGDQTWAVPASAPADISLAPASDQTILANTSRYVCDWYEVVNTYFTEIADTGIMEIG